MAPVRPTWTRIDSSRVARWIGGNFQAIAQRGDTWASVATLEELRPRVLAALQDGSLFPDVSERLQQGIIDQVDSLLVSACHHHIQSCQWACFHRFAIPAWCFYPGITAINIKFCICVTFAAG